GEGRAGRPLPPASRHPGPGTGRERLPAAAAFRSRLNRRSCVLVPPRQAVLHRPRTTGRRPVKRSEEHTSELQSRENLVCRPLRVHVPPSALFPYTTLFRSAVKAALAGRFHLHHVTLDLELDENACLRPRLFGHG